MTSDFDDALTRLQDLRDKVSALDGSHEVALGELLSPEFMKAHTEFTTVDDLFHAAGYVIESQDDFERIPEEELDQFIASHTEFHGWQEMQAEAAADWMRRQLEP